MSEYSNAQQAIRNNVDEDDRKKLGDPFATSSEGAGVYGSTLELGVPAETNTRNANAKNFVFIIAAGLYYIILESKTAEAKAFKK